MGRPKKVVKKYNPSYTRTTVRMSLQNTLSKNRFGGLEKEDNTFIMEVLKECEKIYEQKKSHEKLQNS